MRALSKRRLVLGLVAASLGAGALLAPGRPALAGPEPTCRDQRVVMLMADWCPWCRKATAFFKKHDVAVVEINVDKTDNERIRALRKKAGLPTILVGDTVVEGYQETRLRKMLCIDTD